MTIDSASFVSAINVNLPETSAAYSTAWRDIISIKEPILNSFPNINSEVSASSGEINTIVGLTTSVDSQLRDVSANLATMSSSLNTRIKTLSESLSVHISTVDALSSTFADTSAQLASAISTRMIKTIPATSGNIALLNSTGQVIDSNSTNAYFDSFETEFLLLSATATTMAHGLNQIDIFNVWGEILETTATPSLVVKDRFLYPLYELDGLVVRRTISYDDTNIYFTPVDNNTTSVVFTPFRGPDPDGPVTGLGVAQKYIKIIIKAFERL